MRVCLCVCVGLALLHMMNGRLECVVCVNEHCRKFRRGSTSSVRDWGWHTHRHVDSYIPVAVYSPAKGEGISVHSGGSKPFCSVLSKATTSVRLEGRKKLGLTTFLRTYKLKPSHDKVRKRTDWKRTFAVSSLRFSVKPPSTADGYQWNDFIFTFKSTSSMKTGQQILRSTA